MITWKFAHQPDLTKSSLKVGIKAIVLGLIR